MGKVKKLANIYFCCIPSEVYINIYPPSQKISFYITKNFNIFCMNGSKTISAKIVVNLKLYEKSCKDKYLFENGQKSKEYTEFIREDIYFKYNFVKNFAEAKINKNVYSIDSVLRILYSILLAKNSGILFHAAGITIDNYGYLFVGPTGSGKSTTIKWFRKNFKNYKSYIELSDELVPVKVKGGKIYTWQSLFWGELKNKTVFQQGDISMFTLKKIYFLSGFNEKTQLVTPVGIKETVELLLKNLFWVVNSQMFANDILKTVTNIAMTVPAFKLYPPLHNDYNFVEILK